MPTVKKEPPLNPIHGVQDCVYVCTKVEGNVENFKFIPIGQCRMVPGGPTVQETLDAKNKQIEELTALVKKYTGKIQRFAKAFKGSEKK